MTITFTGSSTTGFIATGNNEIYITSASDTLTSVIDGFNFRVVENSEYILFGNIVSNFDGIHSEFGPGGFNEVVIQEGASVYGRSDGVSMFGEGNRVTNNGTVFGDEDSGITLRGDNTRITNNGQVNGTIEGLASDGDNAVLVNTGTVQSEDVGVLLDGDGGKIMNSGKISSASRAVEMTGSGRLDNSGQITGSTLGILINSEKPDEVFLFNSGTISTLDEATRFFPVSAAILGNDGEEHVQNSGLIQGDVMLMASQDSVLNTGTIMGTVDLGGGADVFTNRGDGLVTGLVEGGFGNDTLIGARSDDDMSGGADNDLLRGQGGSDSLGGGTGNDTLYGNRGGDTLLGGANSDKLVGGTGDDLLEGGSGKDTLYGGNGNDTLLGQTGQDFLFGGEGEDVFVFNKTSHSAVGNGRDVIRDFNKGEDKIDIDDLSADEFIFLGNSAFNGTGDAEVRVTVNGNGDSVVRVDVDGDGTSDTEYLVRGVDNLDAGDFIL